MLRPKAITPSQEPKGIMIEWEDNHKGTYPYSFLRQACPCALCQGKQKGKRTPLAPKPIVLSVHPDLSPLAFEAKETFNVGNYAIGFRWGDGHATGIYPFDYLRKICPCPECLHD